MGQERSLAPTLLTMAAFVALWLILDRSAAALGSFRGEAGLIVCAIVLIAAISAESLLSRTDPLSGLRALGLGAPRTQATLWCVALCAAMLAFLPAFSALASAPFTVRTDAAVLALGMFLQGGIAEEAVFRGFLFRRLRQGRSFWRAALLAAIPFSAVHLILFFTMEPLIAFTALLVSISISFPLAWLFERSGNSIWACALLHAVVQAGIKLIGAEPPAFQLLAVAWMAIAILAPWLLFFIRPRPDEPR